MYLFIVATRIILCTYVLISSYFDEKFHQTYMEEQNAYNETQEVHTCLDKVLNFPTYIIFALKLDVHT